MGIDTKNENIFCTSKHTSKALLEKSLLKCINNTIIITLSQYDTQWLLLKTDVADLSHILVVDYTYKWNVLPVGMKLITNSFIVSLIAAFTNFRAAMLAL